MKARQNSTKAFSRTRKWFSNEDSKNETDCRENLQDVTMVLDVHQIAEESLIAVMRKELLYSLLS